MLSVLLPWLLEDKIIAMTAVGMAMACWIAVLAVAEAVQRVSRGTKTLSATGGMVAAHLRAGGDDYRHRLQPELQRGA
ncbi:hypothetical protein [Salmonella enterica]|uniref:hypothetical protein n=1 Tax=Salmonella enterica TaxID=28901 RepID=UPI0030C87BAD